MTILERVEKIKSQIDVIVEKYFLIEKQLQILLPLLNDKNLYKSWDGEEGVEAVETLRVTLALSIVSNIHAMMFGNPDNSASMVSVMNALEDNNVKEVLKSAFITMEQNSVFSGKSMDDEAFDRMIEKQKSRYEKDQKELFDIECKKVITEYKSLKKSELHNTIRYTRNKIISHIGMKMENGERKPYSPDEFNLKWGDPRQIVEVSKGIVFDAYLLIKNTSFDLDEILSHNEKASKSFWSKIKKEKA